MHQPAFQINAVNLDCHVIDDGQKTVATVSPQGYLDWVIPSPDAPGRLIRRIEVETHMAWVLGTKFNLHFCHLTECMDSIDFEPLDHGRRLLITSRSHAPDSALVATHRALLEMDEASGRYRWTLDAVLHNTSSKPVALRAPFIEYTNVYPSGCGRCMLFAPEKRFDRTLLRDADNIVWHFPHQHAMHYSRKIKALNFARGSAVGGFFGEALNPVVTLHDSTLPPDWAICDMYYDLHCGLRPAQAAVEPGAVHTARCTIEYWDRDQADAFEQGSRYIPVTADDYRSWHIPRFELGKNEFTRCVRIDDVDDASGFPPCPPVKVWDRETGPEGKGSLRISNASSTQTVWSAEPPTQIPPNKRFRLVALAKVRNVTGKGLFLRIRYHAFEWRPEPHVEWEKTLESVPLNGDSGSEWVRIQTPVLKVPANRKDRFVWLDIVLEGEGVAWVTEVEADLRNTEAFSPVQPVDTPRPGRRPVRRQ